MDDFKILLQTILDANAKNDIDKQLKAIKNLSVTISKANLDQSVINDIKRQLSQNGIDVNLVLGNTSQIQNQAKQTGQQIGNAVAQGISQTANKVSGALKSFSDLRNFSELNKSISNFHVDASELKNYQTILDNVKNTYSEFGQVKITNESFNNGILEKFKVNIEQVNGDLKETKSFMMSLNDNKDAFTFNGLINGSESVVQHLDKTKNAVNQTAEAINALKTKAQTEKIQLSIDDGTFSTQIEKMKADFQKYGLSVDEAENKVKELRTTLSTMEGVSGEKLVSQFDTWQNKIKATKVQLDQAKLAYDKFAQPVSNEKISSLLNRIDTFLTKNHKITKSAREELERYKQELSMGNVPLNRYNEINFALKKTENTMRGLGKLGASLKDQFSQAATSFTQWISVSSAIMAVVYQLKKMPEEVKELDAAITDLTMATGASKTQVEGYIDSYAELGDKLKATVTDVTISGTEWLKQGQSIADTETLITDAMVLSKVGKLSSADATKYLTSAMKGYKVSVEDTLGVVDKLSAVDMASATDVGGLAEGMSAVASSADLAGVSMDKLLGYLAAVGEVTQEGMSQTGTTFNAIFSRMGNIKLARLKDYQNNGEDLSNVETVLRGVDIQLRDSQDSFRDFDEVLDETASRWSTFSDVQQRAVASAFAGTHHLNEFIVLMENYDKALQYSEVSMESSGKAMEKFSAYQDSMAGHIEENKNAFIRLSNTLIDSDFLKGLVDIGTTFLNILNVITDKIGVFSVAGGALATGLSLKNLGGLKMLRPFNMPIV